MISSSFAEFLSRLVRPTRFTELGIYNIKNDVSGVVDGDSINSAIRDLVNLVQTNFADRYTKEEVDNIISLIKQFAYTAVDTLPTASADTMWCIYFVPSTRPSSENVKDEFITIRTGEEGNYTYSWEQVGSTAVDISTKLDGISMTKAEYDALAEKDPNMLYVVSEYTEPTFGGITIAPAPLYYGENGFEISSSGWQTNSYGTLYGAVNGSTYFTISELASYFDSRGANFSQGDTIDNANTISFGGYDNWRIPTKAEVDLIVNEGSGARPGATVNGSNYIRRSLVKIPGYSAGGNDDGVALLIFPDNAVITGRSLSENDSFTIQDVNLYLAQGCVALLGSCYYNTSYGRWNTQLYAGVNYMTVTYANYNDWRYYSLGFNKKPSYSHVSASNAYGNFYNPVVLVRDTAIAYKVYKGTTLVSDSTTVDTSTKENSSNKVTALSASSTDTQYPSAKAVYDAIGNVESLLSSI